MKKIMLLLLFLLPVLGVAKENNPALQESALFIDLTHPKILYAKNPTQRLIPASVTKLFVASAALKQFGSDYVFSTPVYARGELKKGILQGDLIFYGSGDPTITNEKIMQMINQLQLLGLKEIHGNIVVNNAYFGAVTVTDSDRIKAKSQSAESYDGLLSSAASNFGTVGITIFPGEENNAPAKIVLVPAQMENIVLTGKVVTSDKSDPTIKLLRKTENNKEMLYVSGTMPLNSLPLTLYRSVGSPDQATGALLKVLLQQSGIKVTGKVKIESTALQAQDKLLTAIQSDQLTQIIWQMLLNSNNFIADMLTLDIWRQTHPANIQLPKAAENLLSSFKDMLTPPEFAVQVKTLPVLDSGSGLTPTNQVSAQDLVALLNGMYHDTQNFPVFYGDLIPMSSTPHLWKHVKLDPSDHLWMNRVSMKTGSLTEPDLVFTMAGYFRLKNGDFGAFAIMLNKPADNTTSRSDLRQELIHQLDNFFA